MNRDMKEGRVSRIQSCASRITLSLGNKANAGKHSHLQLLSQISELYLYIYLAIISRASTIKEKEKA